MIVQRMVFETKPGRREEMVEILQDIWKLMDHPPTYRIYRTITGQFNEVFMEIEFEDFEQYEKFWADAVSHPERPPLIEKWFTVVDSGSSTEFLTLVE